jgi:hypothetical protein
VSPPKEPDALASGQRPLNYKTTKALRINPESFYVKNIAIIANS